MKLISNSALNVLRPNTYIAVLSEVWQRLEEEDGVVHEHPTRCQDAHTAGQFVCWPTETRQSRTLLHQTLPETTQSPVVCLHMATGKQPSAAAHTSKQM